MKTPLFKGCATAIATPFCEKGVNFEEFGRLIEDQIQKGIDAIVVCGTTGEASTMTEAEKKETIKYAVDVTKKRVPIIAGTGGNNTSVSIEMSKWAEEVGVDGLLLVTPYYNKCTQDGLVAHYTAIAESVNLPIIVYSVKSRTGVNISPDTCKKISKIPNIVAIKEASGDLSQIAEIAHLCGDELYIYSGNDDQTVPILSLGGLGVISVLSNIAPKETTDMVHDFLEGRVDKARETQLRAIPLISALFKEVNPIPVKEALNIMGYNFGKPRLPLTKLTEASKEVLKKEMQNFGIYCKN